MELKVWVEGIQRIVCGVTENTSCQDVVYALAHATGKTGRFTLIERWRNNERLLSPNDHPLKILLKWGEYASDVQFILQHSQSSHISNNSDGAKSPEHRNKELMLKKSFTFNAAAITGGDSKNGESNSGPSKGTKKLMMEDNLSNWPLKREAPPYRNPPTLTSSSQQPPRALPPYREPPPPMTNSNTTPNSKLNQLPNSNSPSPITNNSSSMIVQANCKILKPTRRSNGVLISSPPPHNSSSPPDNSVISGNAVHEQAAVLCNSQYRDLVRLVNYQREKLSAQQSELTKFDAEIIYWESKAKEQQHQLEFLCQEKAKMEAATRQNEEHLRALLHAEADFELVRQQEKTLKSEISLVRSKLANCETELLQCKNKIRVLAEELQSEHLAALRESDERQHLERALAHEVDRLQQEIAAARQTTDASSALSDQLHRELANLEQAARERKRQLEQLLTAIKEANLASLAIAPQDELKHIAGEPGIARKMRGSPRQLENAVPTSKNPHGVWV